MAEQKKADLPVEPSNTDPHQFEAIPGAKGPEAIGSGQALPDAAVDGMSARLAALEPEPPKVGPVGNVDLYATPGGYQVVPAGMDPKDVGKVVNSVGAPSATSGDVGEVKKVAGPGASTVK